MIARYRAHGPAVHGAPNWIFRVGVVEHQVGTARSPIYPVLNFAGILIEGGCDNALGCCPIGIGGGGGDSRLAMQALSEVVVSPGDMSLQGVSAVLLVYGKIVRF